MHARGSGNGSGVAGKNGNKTKNNKKKRNMQRSVGVGRREGGSPDQHRADSVVQREPFSPVPM